MKYRFLSCDDREGCEEKFCFAPSRPSRDLNNCSRPSAKHFVMKNVFFTLLFLAAAAGGMILFHQTAHSETPAAAETKTLYTCGMHPQVIQDHPGNCPICGMKLVPIRKQVAATAPAGERKIKLYQSTMNPGETSPVPAKDSMGMDMVPVYDNDGAAANSSTIAIDPVTIQNMNIRTMRITRGPLRRTISTVGTIEHSETGTVDVTTKFRGWVEKLFVDATGQLVHRGEPMFEIYSPEIFSAETEYVLALSSATGTNDTLKEIARRKLSYLDMSDAQITELEKTRQPTKTIEITSPIDGYVMEKMVVQGQMVEAGMKLYELVNHDTIWVLAKVYEQDLPLIRLGQEASVSITSLPGAQFRGRVTFIYPTLDEKTRAATVRLEFHNPGHLLKPGMFASVQIAAESERTALLVPDSAVLRSGERNTVFVALDGGKFDPRTVVLGAEAEDDMDEVINGLSDGDRVVTSGQFMLDSESQLREAIEKMRGAIAKTTFENTNAQATRNELPIQRFHDSTAEETVYVCPMPEHVSIIYDHAGKCPICGMELVPVKRSELKKFQPEGVVLYYTCPMPEHASVHESKPGKCPICGMTLIPVMSGATNLPPAKTEIPASAPMTNSTTQTAQTNSAAKPKQLYTCPMHPDVISDKPGKCPKCEMDLVPVDNN
jgi:RND family efflux transporter MFP subunit